jgi:hypothetical protein
MSSGLFQGFLGVYAIMGSYSWHMEYLHDLQGNVQYLKILMGNCYC